MTPQAKNETLEQNIRDALRPVTGARPVTGLQIAAGGRVLFAIEADPREGAALESLRLAAERAVAALPGVAAVTAVLTAEKRPAAGKGAAKIENLLPQVKRVIAVASGKGGVGKSTVAANLAAALAQAGKRTGLLDADIYGPSAPRMMGLSGQRPRTEGGRIVPLEAHGLKVMSIGFMVDEGAPLVWRGPMVQSALRQMMEDVEWGGLDFLIVDTPPGTGDAQLTLAQKAGLAGAVIVSTPQDIALIDARKGIEMFRKTGVPVLGIVENMSVYACPACGHEEHIFGHGGARAEATRLGCPFLGEIPLHPAIRLKSDEGAPVVLSDPQSPAAAAFRGIAAKISAGQEP